MAVREDYVYKMSRGGVTLGLLNDVKSDFGYNANLNSPGAQIMIELGRSPDKSVPDFGDGSLIQEGNQIEISRVNSLYPQGKVLFVGYVSRITANFGGAETIQFTCLSYGTQLNNILIESGDSTYLSQTAEDGWSIGAFAQDKSFPLEQDPIQVFALAADKVIGGLDLKVSTTAAATMGVSIRQRVGSNPDPNSDPIVMSGSLALAAGLSKAIVHMTFLGATTLTSANTYYIMVDWGDFSTLTLWGSDANPYAGGSVWYVQNNSGTSWDAAVQISGSDLYFVIYQHGGSTVASYSGVDPSFILDDIMSSYVAGGGVIIPPANPITPILSCPLNDGNVPGAFWGAAYAQTVTPAAGMIINIVQLDLGSSSGSEFVTVQLVRGDPTLDSPATIGGSFSYTLGGSNTILATSNTREISSTTANITGFSFASPVTLVAGTQYYILVTFGQAEFSNLIFKGGTSSDSIPAPFGDLYYGLITFNNSGATMAFHSATPAFYVNLAYQLPVPTSLDGGYPNTGNVVDYVFKVNTILEGINEVLQLSPQDWYWYLDMGTNILYFQEQGTVADHVMVKGKHINELNLTRTSEQIKNIVVFSGGDTGGGVNLFVKETNPTSLASYPAGLDRLSNNRVADAPTADLLIQDDLDRNAAPIYQTTIKIPNGQYDIDSFKLGQMMGFQNFNNFVDALLLQIVGINYAPDLITLSLGSKALRSTQTVQQLQRQLVLLQTVANPATPS